MTPTRVILGVAAVPLALVLAACGGDAKSADGAEDAVRGYIDNLSEGDYDDACERWSDDYTDSSVKEWNEDGWGDDVDECVELLEEASGIAAAFGEDLEDIEIDEISAEVDGDEATVDVSYQGGDSESETYLLTWEDGQWLIADDLDEGEDDGEAAAEETSEAPEPIVASIGEVVTLGDWSIEVVEVDDDAAEEIEKANEFNDKAAEGYVLVTYEATYNGTERTADAEWDLTWSLSTSDATVNEPASVVTEADNEEWPSEVRPGGSIRGQVCFDVDPELLSGGSITVETYDADYTEVFADFQL